MGGSHLFVFQTNPTPNSPTAHLPDSEFRIVHPFAFLCLDKWANDVGAEVNEAATRLAGQAAGQAKVAAKEAKKQMDQWLEDTKDQRAQAYQDSMQALGSFWSQAKKVGAAALDQAAQAAEEARKQAEEELKRREEKARMQGGGPSGDSGGPSAGGL